MKFYQNFYTGCRNIILEIPGKLGKFEHLSDVQTTTESPKIIIER